MRNTLAVVLILVFASSCEADQKKDETEKWKKEIVETEQDFARMVEKEGIPKAFLNYAAEDAVILRNNELIMGKEAIRESYNKQERPDTISLSWKPDFVEVSKSGDLGYTYGKYQYSVTDSLGNEKISEGIFHTVWKRQPDGKWKFVWD